MTFWDGLLLGALGTVVGEMLASGADMMVRPKKWDYYPERARYFMGPVVIVGALGTICVFVWATTL